MFKGHWCQFQRWRNEPEQRRSMKTIVIGYSLSFWGHWLVIERLCFTHRYEMFKLLVSAEKCSLGLKLGGECLKGLTQGNKIFPSPSKKRNYLRETKGWRSRQRWDIQRQRRYISALMLVFYTVEDGLTDPQHEQHNCTLSILKWAWLWQKAHCSTWLNS